MNKKIVLIFFMTVILVGINSVRVVNAQRKIAEADTTAPIISSGQKTLCTGSGGDGHILYYMDDNGIWMGWQKGGRQFEWVKIARAASE